MTTLMVLLYFLSRKSGHPNSQADIDLDLETLSTSSEDRRYGQDDALAFAPFADSRSSSPYACTCARLASISCSYIRRSQCIPACLLGIGYRHTTRFTRDAHRLPSFRNTVPRSRHQSCSGMAVINMVSVSRASMKSDIHLVYQALFA